CTDLVTVYIPTKDRLKMLRRALQSVYLQTYRNIEIIVVDDGSTDGTRPFLSKMECEGKLKAVFNERTLGACAARNAAIFLAQGRYITGLDDDDEFLPNHISRLHKSFDTDFSFVACPVTVDNGKRRSVNKHVFGKISKNKLLHYNIVGNQVFTLTERMRGVGGFDEALPALQDYDMWLRLIGTYGAGKKIIHSTYVQYTDHEEGRISSNKKKRLEALRILEHKYGKNFSSAHKKTMLAKIYINEGRRLPFRRLVALLNIGNYRILLPYYIKRIIKVGGRR
ncbi:glycosyltransferase, partial [bacterium]|nr:glycosyltransferase [bacterium]